MAPADPSSRWLIFLRGNRVALVHAVRLMMAGGLFFYVAHAVQMGNSFALEQELMRSLHTNSEQGQPIGPAWLPQAARGVTALGGVVVLTLVVALTSTWLMVGRRYGAAVFLILTALGGHGLNESLKQFYERARPDPEFRLVAVESFSFPSGHAMSSAIVYFALVGLLAGGKRKPFLKITVMIAVLLLCFLIGLSRVYLGVHYPADVMGGWSAAVAWLEICWFTAHVIVGRKVILTA